MAYTKPLLWGGSESFAVKSGVDVLHKTPQLVSVEAPMPCTWQIWITLTGPRDVPFAVTPFLQLGVGLITTPFTITASVTALPMNPLFEIQDTIITPPIIQRIGRIQNMAAQTIAGQLLVSQAAAHVLADDTWTVTMWVAPEVPWQGLEVIPVEPKNPSMTLDEAAHDLHVGRHRWANR